MFFKYSLTHIISLITTVAIHAGIAASSLFGSKPLILHQQTINVSFVAPSANNTKSQDKIIKEEFVEIKKKSTLVKKQQDKKNTKKSEIKKIAGKETSGLVDEKSKNQIAGQSEPIFNVKYLNNPIPFYPSYAKQKGIEGKVLLDVIVTKEGKALEVQIAKSSGSKMLDKAALKAVKNWRFIPARKAGKIVQANVSVPIEFKII